MENIELIDNAVEKVEKNSTETPIIPVEPPNTAMKNPIGELIIDPQEPDISQGQTDTTSLLDLSFEIAKYKKDIFTDDEAEEQLDLFINDVLDREKRKEMDLEEKTRIIEAYCVAFNKKSNAINGNLTLQIIKIGKALMGLKQLVLSERKKRWEEWAKSNVKFLKDRNRQTYMQLAKIPGVERYAVFGKERLLHISGEISPAEDDSDPIGSFLEKHEIPFDPEEETPYSDFKDRVDAAVIVEKAEKQGLELDPELVLELVRIRFKFNTADMGDLKRIEDSNGDPEEYLKKIVMNKGKRDILFEKDKKEESFARYRARMTEAIDFIIKQDNVDKIEPVEIEDLIHKLQELLKKFTE